MKRRRLNKKEFVHLWLPIFGIAGLFLAVSYFMQRYSGSLQEMIQANNATAVFVYLTTLIAAVVVVPLPINTMFIVPMASHVWGPVMAGILSVIGWTIGAMISFVLARRYGRPLVERFISLKKIEQIEKRIPTTNVFWSVVFLRIAFPVDVLSYALGLFTTMSKTKYFFATLLGISPFAFLLSYAETLPLVYQILVCLLVAVLFVSSYYFVKKEDDAPLA